MSSIDFRYGAEALGLLFFAYAIIQWVGRNVRSQIDASAPEDAVVRAAIEQTDVAATASALRDRGIVAPEQLAELNPRERLLLLTATSHLAPRRPTPVTPLRLRRPVERPLGAVIHCPACGGHLNRSDVLTHGETRCPSCERKVWGHIQQGRLVVKVEE